MAGWCTEAKMDAQTDYRDGVKDREKRIACQIHSGVRCVSHLSSQLNFIKCYASETLLNRYGYVHGDYRIRK